jgi:hypothetical protein
VLVVIAQKWNVPCAVQCLGGKADIIDHVSTKIHKVAVSAKSSSQSLTFFFDKINLGDQERELAAQEATLPWFPVYGLYFIYFKEIS